MFYECIYKGPHELKYTIVLQVCSHTVTFNCVFTLHDICYGITALSDSEAKVASLPSSEVRARTSGLTAQRRK